MQYTVKRRLAFKANGLCGQCGKRPPIYGYNTCVPCRQMFSSWATKNYAEWKTTIFRHYGNQCVCCGETERCFLTVDHINNDGGFQRRRDRTGGNSFYRQVAKKIRDGNAPIDLQLLCRNCNWGKNANNGVCPHEEERRKIFSAIAAA